MLTEGKGTKEEKARAAAMARERFAAQERAAADVAARTSEERTLKDGGVTWTYTIFDGVEVHIVRCETTVPVVEMPAEIEGMPVLVVEPDAFENQTALEDVTVADCVAKLGTYAFRGCRNLRRANLACEADVYDATWLRGCNQVEELVFPNGAAAVKPNVFDLPSLRRLTLGRAAELVEPGMFAKSKLESFEISPDNEHIKTDGLAIYSADGARFIALAKPCESYTVADGCRVVAKKSTSTFSSVVDLTLPDTVEELEDFAFSRASIESFVAPVSLRAIGAQAFNNCKKLRRVELNDRLEEVGDEAFSGTPVEELHLPASMKALGNKIAARTSLVFSGEHATFTIDPACEALRLDDQGCLYALGEGGMTLTRMLDPNVDKVVVAEGTTAIGNQAFFNHAKLEAVKLPEGLRVIGEEAFKRCRALYWVEVPSTVERIEREAFLETSIQQIRIPAGLKHLGNLALITAGAYHDEEPPALRNIMVDEGCEKFYKAGGLLCERLNETDSQVVVYDGSDPAVYVPDEVTTVAPYALNGAVNIASLRLADKARTICIRGLGFDCHIPDITIDVAEPIEGHSTFHFAFPDNDRGKRQEGNAFGVMKAVDPRSVYYCYDLTVTNSGSFFDTDEENLDELYDQLKLIIERIEDPIFMLPVTHDTIDKIFLFHVTEITRLCAHFGDTDMIGRIRKLGYLTADNIASAAVASDAAVEEARGKLDTAQDALAAAKAELELSHADQEKAAEAVALATGQVDASEKALARAETVRDFVVSMATDMGLTREQLVVEEREVKAEPEQQAQAPDPHKGEAPVDDYQPGKASSDKNLLKALAGI